METLQKIFAPDVYYHDPFHDVTGAESIHKIYIKVFEKMDETRIKVNGYAVNGFMAFVSLKISVSMKKKKGELEGTTCLVFDENGLVKESLGFSRCLRSIRRGSYSWLSHEWVRKHMV